MIYFKLVKIIIELFQELKMVLLNGSLKNTYILKTIRLNAYYSVIYAASLQKGTLLSKSSLSSSKYNEVIAMYGFCH